MRGKRLLGERKCYLVGPTYNAGAQLGLVGGGGHPAEKWRELPPHAALGHFIRPEPALTCTIQARESGLKSEDLRIEPGHGRLSRYLTLCLGGIFSGTRRTQSLDDLSYT